jgi:chromosome segregation ATPase
LKEEKSNTDTDKKDLESLIEELENEISKRDDTIKHLQEELEDSRVRIGDMIEKNKSLEVKLNEYELKDVSMKIGKFEELKQEVNKLDHRIKITKKHLEEIGRAHV